jgi:hypothetical protein
MQATSNLSCGKAFWHVPNEQSKNVDARLLGKRRERIDGE